MILEQLTLLNYKNVAEAELRLSPNVNCFIGANGMGKTNVLDAIYFLSFGKSATALTDSNCVRHEADFFMLQGQYLSPDGTRDAVSCALKRGQRKRLRRNDKDYKRLSEHVGAIPLVMLSPSDEQLVTGGSEERRKFMDSVIAQTSPRYLEALIRYGKTLQQRNALLKQEGPLDEGLFDVLESLMDADAAVIYAARSEFVSPHSTPDCATQRPRQWTSPTKATPTAGRSARSCTKVVCANRSWDTPSTVRTKTISIC